MLAALATEPTSAPPMLAIRRAVLLPIVYVREARGWHFERIQAAIDCGELQWVWDISGGKREHRELRFWTREIIAPETCIMLRTDSVISSILGAREFWSVADLCNCFLCTRPLVNDLFATKALARLERQGLWSVSRAGLKQFLHDRLIAS